MTNGELLYKTIEARGLFVSSSRWESLVSAQQDTFELVANELLALAKPLSLVRTWKAELQKYGRHTPDCPSGLFVGAECTCGYAEIEKELVA